MDVVERYLEAVSAQLSADERDDIIAELRDLILSRIEAKEDGLDRPLSDEEREAILKEIGHPLVVAARYRKGPDSLIGPELFPYWLYGVKAGLLVLLAVSALGLLIRLVSGSANFGQDIAQTFHGFFGSGLTLIGALTLAGAIMEHYGIRPKWLTHWRVRDLSAFQLSDPSQWGASAAGTTSARATWAPWTGITRSRIPAGESVFSLLAVGLFVLWWIGLVHFPGLAVLLVDGQRAAVSPAPIWASLYLPILVYAVGQMGVDLFSLIQPHALRMRAVLSILIGIAGVWLTWTIFQAGHWFTLSVAGDQARIAGDWTLMSLDRLRNLGGGERSLVGLASTLSLIMTWCLAISGAGLIFQVLGNLRRAAMPDVATGAGR